MKNQRYVIPQVAGNSAYLIQAEIRFIKKQDHEDFGKCRVWIGMQFDPISRSEAFRNPVPEDEAIRLLVNNGGIRVRDDFDYSNVYHLKEIKDKLSTEWVEIYNLRVGEEQRKSSGMNSGLHR